MKRGKACKTTTNERDRRPRLAQSTQLDKLDVPAQLVCQVDGCGRATYQSKIYCGAHRGRFYRYGDPLGVPAPRRADLTGARFGALVVLRYDTDARRWVCLCPTVVLSRACERAT